MKVNYIHTFTVTVEGSDNFHDDTDLSKAISEGKQDAGYITLHVKRGGGPVVPVRSKVHTRTVVVHEEGS